MSRWNHNVILLRGISFFLISSVQIVVPWPIGRSYVCKFRITFLLSDLCGLSKYRLHWLTTSFFLTTSPDSSLQTIFVLFSLSSVILICGGFFVPTFPEEILISGFQHLFQIKTSACDQLSQTADIHSCSYLFSKTAMQSSWLVFLKSVSKDS